MGNRGASCRQLLDWPCAFKSIKTVADAAGFLTAANERTPMTLRFGPLSRQTAHLCIDMQKVFAEPTPWHTPWKARLAGGRGDRGTPREAHRVSPFYSAGQAGRIAGFLATVFSPLGRDDARAHRPAIAGPNPPWLCLCRQPLSSTSISTLPSSKGNCSTCCAAAGSTRW